MASTEKIRTMYDVYRSYIEHEDNLINHRTTWFITVQSFLIATFGFSYQKKYEIIAKIIIDQETETKMIQAIKEYDEFLLVLCLVGFIISLITLYSVSAASTAIAELERGWTLLVERWKKGADPEASELLDELPKIIGGGSDKAARRGMMLPNRLPIAFLMFWSFSTLFLVAVTLGFFEITLGAPR